MARKKHFFFSVEGKKYLEDYYVSGIKSAGVIAEEHNTYDNMIYRALKFHGLPRKSKSEAQKLALANGTSKHPTAGLKRDPKIKRKIGQAVFKANQKLTEEEKQKRIDKRREIWLNIPEKTRKEYTEKSHKKIREDGQKGSEFERFMVAALLAAKYKIQIHHKLEFIDSEMTVDIFLPVEGICIEVDGPIHFAPIFGEETLQKRIEKDLKKNAELIAQGYSVIRIQNPKGYTSVSFVEDFISRFIPFLKTVAQASKNEFHQILLGEF